VARAGLLRLQVQPGPIAGAAARILIRRLGLVLSNCMTCDFKESLTASDSMRLGQLRREHLQLSHEP